MTDLQFIYLVVQVSFWVSGLCQMHMEQLYVRRVTQELLTSPIWGFKLWHSFAHCTRCKPRNSARSRTTLLKHSVTFWAMESKRLKLVVARLEGVVLPWSQMYVKNRWGCGSEFGKRQGEMSLFSFVNESTINIWID